MKKIYSADTVKKIYDSGIFDRMVGADKSIDVPPKILQRFFTGDIAYIKNRLHKNKVTLEVGCGFGRLLTHLSAVSKKVTGIDFCKSQIKKSGEMTKELANVKTKLMRAERMSFKNNSFDQALCLNNSLGNMPGIETRVIQEMKRVTKSGGKIIIRVFADNKAIKHAQHENYRRLGFTGIQNLGRAVVTDEGFYSRRFTRKDLRMLFKKAGLKPLLYKDGEIGYIAEATKE